MRSALSTFWWTTWNAARRCRPASASRAAAPSPIRRRNLDIARISSCPRAAPSGGAEKKKAAAKPPFLYRRQSIVVAVAVAVVFVLVPAARPAGAAVGESVARLLLEFRDQVHADVFFGLDVSAAAEIRLVVGAAGASVDRRLRIRAEQAGARRDGAAFGLDRLWRIPVFNPVDLVAKEILRLRSHAATAVRHTGREAGAGPMVDMDTAVGF